MNAGQVRIPLTCKLREVTFDRQESVELSVRTFGFIITQKPLRFCLTALLNTVPCNKNCRKHCWSQTVRTPGTRRQVYEPFRYFSIKTLLLFGCYGSGAPLHSEIQMMTLITRAGTLSQGIFQRLLCSRVKTAITSRSEHTYLDCWYCVCKLIAAACVCEQCL